MFFLVLVYSYFVRVLTNVLRFLKVGNGTTWSGLIFEKYCPSAISLLANKGSKIILISGTNGKTTTRSMLVKIYEDQGIKVCTNRGGANIFRGVAAALLSNLTLAGQPNAQNIILEVEEATMPILTRFITPNKIILTNIFRDQMDAYGEINTTLEYFSRALNNLKNTNFDLIINKDDSKLLSILNKKRPNINLVGYGINDKNVILPDYELSENIFDIGFQKSFVANNINSKSLEVNFDIKKNISESVNLYVKEDFKDLNSNIKGEIESAQTFAVKTSLLGVYNIYNILAAFATSYDDFGTRIIDSLESVPPVFGRGEKVMLPNGSQIIMLLVKNPAGMNQVFDLIKTNFESRDIGLNFLINDNIADGRDVSWLWDCNFEDLVPNLDKSAVVKTSGTRGLDMLLRLETAGADVSLQNNFDKIARLVKNLIEKENPQKIELVLATYTAMLEFRSELGKFVELGGISEKGN